MSTLESVCASAEALAEMVLRYEPMRAENPFEAARLRRRMVLAASGVRVNASMAREKRDTAMKAVRPVLSGICRCGCAACPQPAPTPANDASSEAPSIG